MKPSKAAKRIDAAVRDLFEVAEQLGYLAHCVANSEVLKEAALRAGVDHTREPDWVVGQLGDMAAQKQIVLDNWTEAERRWRADLSGVIAEYPESLSREPGLRDALEELARPRS